MKSDYMQELKKENKRNQWNDVIHFLAAENKQLPLCDINFVVYLGYKNFFKKYKSVFAHFASVT